MTSVSAQRGVGGGGSGGTPRAVSGVQLAQGIGVQQAKGFWADAWSQVLKRPVAVAALAWLGFVAFLGVFGPLLASGHPIWMERTLVRNGQADGTVTSSPLLTHLRPSDAALVLGAFIGVPWILLGPRARRGDRLWHVVYGGLLGMAVVVGAAILQGFTSSRDAEGLARRLREVASGGVGGAAMTVAVIAVPVLLAGVLLPAIKSRAMRLLVPAVAVGVAWFSCAATWQRGLEIFDYRQREAAGEVRAVYTLVPFSPSERYAALDRKPPGTTLGSALRLDPGTPGAGRTFMLGTDGFGQDVLSQLVHASRLAISIGLVSTGIAVIIGVTLGALMGYFGGWVDLVLFRLVEIFQAVPLLFLLIVAAAVLPPELRSTYVMMAIIGCFTWTGAARFTRAEFFRLRSQDFVQSAKAVGLPLRSILFKHMLPNGVTPVLVDASFAIAAAITLEATLSYLGLGPADQASWGKLLSSAMNAEGQFKWWLAVFPGAAIFLTVLSYNLLGETLRDAIDPKLKKARV